MLDIETRLKKIPKKTKFAQLLEQKYHELVESLEHANKEILEAEEVSRSNRYLKLVPTGIQLHGVSRYKRQLKTMMTFLCYIKRHEIALFDAMTMPLYREPHFHKDSKEFFQAVRSVNVDKVRRMLGKDRLLAFQIDYVTCFSYRWARRRPTGRSSATPRKSSTC